MKLKPFTYEEMRSAENKPLAKERYYSWLKGERENDRKESKRQGDKIWRFKNKEKFKGIKEKWRKENPEMVKEQQRRHNEKRKLERQLKSNKKKE